MVEFVIVLPVLLALVFGTIYFGRYESYSQQMTQLSEVGARDAAVGLVATSSNGACSGAGTNPSIACLIQNQATGELAAGSSNVAQVSVYVDCNPGSTSDTTCNDGDSVTVCLQATVQFPVLGLASSLIYQKATMLVETQPSLTTYVTNSQAGPNVPSC